MKPVVHNETIVTDHVSWYVIIYKLLLGICEFLLGLGITIFGRDALHWYKLFAARELSEDPHDILVRVSESIIPNMLAHHTLLSLYLLVLGGAKIAGAVGLMYKKYWGVDILVALTLLLLPFQLIQLLYQPSLIDFLYILVGLVIALYLIDFRPHLWVKRVTTKVRRRSPS